MIKKHVALTLALFTAGAIYLGSATDTQASTRHKHTSCVVKQQKKVCHTYYHTHKTKVAKKKNVSKKAIASKKPAKKKIYADSSKAIVPKKSAKKKIHAGSSSTQALAIPKSHGSTIRVAKAYVGATERGSRGKLMGLFNFAFDHRIDPAKTPWCAAFANAVLKKTGKRGTGSLAANSFTSWGKKTHNPKNGDIVVLKPGRRYHVGFYVGTVKRNGRTYVAVLGGNQSNQVKISYYPASKVVAYRTA